MEDQSDADVRRSIGRFSAGDYLEIRGGERPAGSGRRRPAQAKIRTPRPNPGLCHGRRGARLTILGVTIQTDGSTQFRDVNDAAQCVEFFIVRPARWSRPTAEKFVDDDPRQGSGTEN
jgi:hypothetical protein